MNENNQQINCSVESCMFQNNSYCTLKEIQVGNSESHEANIIKETACNSFRLDETNNK